MEIGQQRTVSVVEVGRSKSGIFLFTELVASAKYARSSSVEVDSCGC